MQQGRVNNLTMPIKKQPVGRARPRFPWQPLGINGARRPHCSSFRLSIGFKHPLISKAAVNHISRGTKILKTLNPYHSLALQLRISFDMGYMRQLGGLFTRATRR